MMLVQTEGFIGQGLPMALPLNRKYSIDTDERHEHDI